MGPLNRSILITGATDGLGLELFRLFRRSGDRVFGLGRRLHDSFPHLSAENYLQVDLAAPNLAQRFQKAWEDVGSPTFDIVIHNAGVGYLGSLAEQSEMSVRDLVRVNLIAPILITRLLLPELLVSGGKLVFVSSVTASLPTPSFAAYGASKAALEGFARSLKVELAGRVQVQVIRPGATRTGMHQKVGMAKEKTLRFASPEKDVPGYPGEGLGRDSRPGEQIPESAGAPLQMAPSKLQEGHLPDSSNHRRRRRHRQSFDSFLSESGLPSDRGRPG